MNDARKTKAQLIEELTELRQRMESLENERKQGKEIQQIWTRALDSMVEEIVVVDEHGIITLASSTFDAMFGYEHGELNGQYVSVLNDYSEEENIQFVERTLGKIKSEGVWQGEFSNKRKDGTSFTTFARITILEYEGKQHLVSVQEDITERKKNG